jgi:hypothetical protein
MTMNKDDLLVSLKRTLVPITVGVVAGSFLAAHVDVGSLEKVVSGVISGVYYTAIRLIESRCPTAGVLLGSKKQPVYVDSTV